MNDTLLDRLTQLDLEEKSLKRNLDKYYCDNKKRTKLFNRIKEIKKEKEEIKRESFKLKLERKINNEKSR